MRVGFGTVYGAWVKCHVNGIESFWSYAKRRLAKFNGIASAKFVLHLKECKFRFYNGGCV